MPRPDPHRRGDYPHTRVLTTRWIDSDPYGHMNNVVHYALFDTVVNAWLIERGALDIQKSPVIGLVVETGCHYFAPLTYPEPVTAGLRVAHIGRSSVHYELALFGSSSDVAAAQGRFVHVYVDRASRRPVAELPAALRLALEPLRVVSPTKEIP
jgi:acyl-CoA thioester hydrolase